MGNTLKDALLKIGLKGTKSENERETTRGQKLKKSEKFQQDRNFCEVCETHQRDVEQYKHRNRLLDANWLCVVCADKEMIDDQFRVTNQSEFAKSGQFRRSYGATKVFGKESINHKKTAHNSNRNSANSGNSRNFGNSENPGNSRNPGNSSNVNGSSNDDRKRTFKKNYR